MRTLAERLSWAREQKQLTQDELAKLAGVSQGTIGNLESGLRQSARRIVNIAAALEVDAIWLSEGRGTPFKEATPPAATEDAEAYIAARIDQARADAIVQGSQAFQPVLISNWDDNGVDVPLVELKLSAGVSGFGLAQDSEAPTGTVRVEPAFITSNGYDPSRLVAVRIRGESMEPKLSHGDLVIIDTSDIKPMDGAVFAVNYEGEAVIKRLIRDAGQWWLASDNPDQRKYHRKLCRGGECIIVGRAVRAITNNL